jgi:hypothetical protein
MTFQWNGVLLVAALFYVTVAVVDAYKDRYDRATYYLAWAILLTVAALVELVRVGG